MTQSKHDQMLALVDRLRATRRTRSLSRPGWKHWYEPINPDGPDAADALTAAWDENERLKASIKRQAGAAKALRRSTLAEVQHIRDAERKEYTATKTLQSERDANAILTEENERLREALYPFSRIVDKETCEITLTWRDGDYVSNYTGVLKPAHFSAAWDALKGGDQ